MELILKISFWAAVVVLILTIGAYTDPTVRRDRRKRKQERLAMDFHDRIKGGHPEE